MIWLIVGDEYSPDLEGGYVGDVAAQVSQQIESLLGVFALQELDRPAPAPGGLTGDPNACCRSSGAGFPRLLFRSMGMSWYNAGHSAARARQPRRR